MFVKFCGMTRRQDVEIAVQLGADAVGFIFADSPRKILPGRAAELAKSISGSLKVGVFVNEDIEKVRDIRKQCRLDVIQLHGDESPEYCAGLGGRIIKAFRLQDESTQSRFADYPCDVLVLLDAWSALLAGGTGKQINAGLLDGIEDFSRIIIAGGLGVDNIVDVIKRYQPYGVDINSKVEKSPGVKDHRLLQETMQLVRSTAV